MNFLRGLFGKQQGSSVPTGELIEVQNRWGESPVFVEQHPNLDSIFSDPTPQLGTAYLSHPDPEVRASTIPYVKHIRTIGISNALADLLADTSSDVRSAAVHAIWETATDSDPDSNRVAFIMRILRDEIQRTGFVSHMSSEEAMQALELLRNAQPSRRNDFNKWMIYAWCGSDEDSAEYGYSLLDIYSKHTSFLGIAKEGTRQVGAEIGGLDAMRAIHEAIELTLGGAAARELEAAWNGIGQWRG